MGFSIYFTFLYEQKNCSQSRTSTALHTYLLGNHSGAQSKSRDLKYNWHLTSKTEAETKANGNPLRLPRNLPQKLHFLPRNARPFVLKGPKNSGKQPRQTSLTFASGLLESDMAKALLVDPLKVQMALMKLAGKYYGKSLI